MKYGKQAAIWTAVCFLLCILPSLRPGGTAAGLRPLRFDTEVTASLESKTDTVGYRVTVEAYGYMECWLRYPKQPLFGETGWRLTVSRMLSPDGSKSASNPMEITQTVSERTGTEVKTERIGVCPGEYRLTLSVNGAYSPDDVGILCLFTECAGCETEPNDSPSRYNELIPGIAKTGTASRHASTAQTDTDCYLLQLTEPGALSVSLSHEALEQTAVAWILSVEDLYGNEITSAQNRFGDTKTTTDTVGVGPGAYVVRVVSRVRSDLVYTLSASVKPATAYEEEFNDTAESANTIRAGVPITGTLAARTSTVDEDWYTISAQEDSVLQVLLTHPVSGDEDRPAWRVRITDENGNTIIEAVSSEGTAVCALPETGVAKGTYFVVVDSDGLFRNGAEYKVALSITGRTGVEKEPNNTPDTAAVIPPDTEITARLQTTQDVDCFRFKTTGYSMLNVTIRTDGTGSANEVYRIRAYDGTGRELPFFDREGWPLTDEHGLQSYVQTVKGNETQKTVYLQTQPGEVTVKVESGLYYSPSEYRITLCEELMH